MRSTAPGQFLRLRIVIVSLIIVLAITIYIASKTPAPEEPEFNPPSTSTATPIPTSTPIPTATEIAELLNTPTATSVPNSIIFTISPKLNDIGWVQSDEVVNHFGESYLYAGLLDGTLYYGAMQFDLAGIPIGSTVLQAELILTGLDDTEVQSENQYELNVLGVADGIGWYIQSFERLATADIEQIAPMIIEAEDIGVEQENRIVFDAGGRGLIENRIEKGKLSFRLSNLNPELPGRFAWDTGYGPNTKGNKPVLRLAIALPDVAPIGEQVTEPTLDLAELGPLVLITSTPTPENLLTAVAIDFTATFETELYGTPTPVAPNWVTPWVIFDTPTPENAATMQIQQAEATLIATARGTATATPENMVTATPTPTYLIVTSTSTPEVVFTAVVMKQQQTAEALLYGPATPLPDNWVTPYVVTSTPTPVNGATAAYWEAVFLTTGTPTPLPKNAQTATPTSVYILLDGELPPMTSTPTPTFTPGPIPRELLGKILFKSDRTMPHLIENPATGAMESAFNENGSYQVFVMNPDGTELGILTDPWPYLLAEQLDQYSADGRFRVFTKDVIRYRDIDGPSPIPFERVDAPGLYWYDKHYQVEEQLSYFGAGIAYEGVWSPTREQIAFISTESTNDEIWVINRDGSDLKQLTRDEYHIWDKHPSWSPDGNQIVFWSNRTGHAQIWVMDRDGNNLFSLSRTGFNDWDPVWVKYLSIPEYIAPQ